MQLKVDFNSRVEEVEIYFAFAKEIDSIETYKQKKINVIDKVQLTVKRDLQKVIRANCFLILYNLIEATIRNSIWSIYDAIHDDNIAFQDLSKNLQNVWLTEKTNELNDISNHSRLKESIKSLIDSRLSNQGVNFSKSRVSLSGNLDYKSIEKLINDFGFHGKTKLKDKTKLGKALLKIKNERNALAHGNKSFRQSAEIVTIQDLFEYKYLVVSFLNDITDNIILYIDKQSYRKAHI